MTTHFIVNGRIVDPLKKIDSKLSILVQDGKIRDITDSKKAPSNADVIDAKGCIVAPGFVDMHVHLREPGHEYKEDIESGTRAASAGGFTTICCMPNTNPVNDTAAVTEFIVDRARTLGTVNVRPIGAITQGLKGEGLADIGDMARAGAVAISDDGFSVMNAELLRRAMEYAKAFGLLVISHCDDINLHGKGVMNEGHVSTELGLCGIPSAAEEVIVARDIMLAALTNTRLHIAHVSTAGAVALIRQAKADGICVTAETTPHHLTLTEEAVAGYDTNTKVNPPLRSDNDRHELIRGLVDGTIDAVATDHAPHDITEKENGFQDAAFGMIGLETALPLTLKLVKDRKLTLKRLVEVLSMAPAKILGFEGKGTLAKGADADIVIFDPDAPTTIQSSRFFSKSRNTPFDGMRVLGKVKWTMSSGRVVFKCS